MAEATSRDRAVDAALQARRRAQRRLSRAGDAGRAATGGRSARDAAVLARSVAPDARQARVAEPRLRLVRPEEGPAHAPPLKIMPITGAEDPRWVLAIRAAAQLQGAMLAPERRQKLIQLGRSLGLTVFDSNLIIAIIQDQARRGRLPDQCAAAGESQLALVPMPELAPWWDGLRSPRARLVALTAAAVTIELLLLLWVF